MIQHEFITLTLAQFGQILKIPYNDQAVFTNEWDLGSLEYSQETEGPYSTGLPTPDDIRQLLKLERVMVDRTIKSQTVTLTPIQILTKELSPDMKQWEELIRKNVFGLGGHQDHLPACLAHMLYCVIAEEQYNLAYFFVKQIECARVNLTVNLLYGMFLTRLYRHIMEVYPHLDNGIYDIVDRVMRPLALKQTRRPRSDHGKARHSVSSSSSHHHDTSSLQHVETSRASTPSPTSGTLHLLNRTIKSQTITLTPNQILTKELIPDIKQWEELIRENVIGLGGHREHLPTCLAHMLYYVVAEEQYNLAYFFVKRIECARANPIANLPYTMFLTRLYRHIMEVYPHLDNGIYDIVDRVMRPLALKQTRRPRSDGGKARHSVSSSFSHHHGTSSHQHDDDDDHDDDVETYRASTPSPTTYLNSLNPLN
ncbi:hypothetical protein Tco_1460109, partial [Tanacetum coccineum]